VALFVVLLVAFAVSAIAVGAALMTTNTHAINLYSDRAGTLEAVADAGLELGRSTINGDRSVYPDSLYVALETDATVTDASGAVIPGVTRSTYVGPTGITTGQYGVFGSVVAVVTDQSGNLVVRRGEVYQESFAKFAYFTDNEGGNIYFGGGDVLWGPVHSNDQIKIHSTGATFNNTVTTARDVYQEQYGTFVQGYTEYAPAIPMPTTAEITKLRAQATTGNAHIVGQLTTTEGQATTRIEFIPVDMNLDGDVTDENEGFMRVYQLNTVSSANQAWISGDVPTDYNSNRLLNSRNCGDYHAGVFRPASDRTIHPNNTSSHNWRHSVSPGFPNSKCFLGGSDSLWGTFVQNDGTGQWLPYPGTVAAAVLARRPLDGGYLWPINRPYNPSFKGVIEVDGDVIVSGVVRGQITIAATGDIIIGDDLTHATNPGAGSCQDDMVGIFAGGNVVVAENLLNAPYVGCTSGTGCSSTSLARTFDETRDEFIHAVVLTLNIFTVENYDGGSDNREACEGTTWGRGCLYLTGGIIQDTRGAVGTTGGTGYLKRYAYDACAATDPPPYFPTTGHFARGRFFEVDPVGFDVAAYYRLLTP
jgi:hypothetical protein